MDSQFLKDVVTGHMEIYKTAYAEGYKEGARVTHAEYKIKLEEMQKTLATIEGVKK